MSSFACLLLFIQGCLVQNIYSQCLRGYGPALAGPVAWDAAVGPAYGWGGLAAPGLFGCAPAAIAAYPEYAAYGGSGVGNVAVAGDMGVAGTTLVAGQVPILGAVEFGGLVPAAGVVTITGFCGCGCNGFAANVAPFAVTPFATPFAAPYAIAGPAVPCGLEAGAVPASNGGGLEVASGSAIPPSGVSVVSENAIEGALAVGGALPFLGTVGLEGIVPTAGAGAVNYGCGNGAVAILAEDISSGLGPFGYGIGPLAVDGLGYGPFGYGPLAGPYGRAGYGCGRLL